MRNCTGLLVILQLLLLPLQLSAAQSLRGVQVDNIDSAGDSALLNAAIEDNANVEEESDEADIDLYQRRISSDMRMLTPKNITALRHQFQYVDKPQRRISSESMMLSAENSTASADIDQFHRDEREDLPFQTRIIGGRDATAGLHSYTVSLQDRNNNHFCGASLVSKDCVLTAAHCSHQVTGKGPITAVIGRSDLSIGGQGERLKIRFERVHPRYDVTKANVEWKFDFAIMCFTRPTMTPAKVIELNQDPEVPRAGSRVTVVGWGDINPLANVRQQSEKLQFANLRMVGNQQCGAITGYYGSYSISYNGFIEEDMMCAKSRKRDSCQGDSGGPLTHLGKQVGITSWGVGCNNKNFPGVYARISSAYPWIRRQMCSRSMYPPASFKCEPW